MTGKLLFKCPHCGYMDSEVLMIEPNVMVYSHFWAVNGGRDWNISERGQILSDTHSPKFCCPDCERPIADESENEITSGIDMLELMKRQSQQIYAEKEGQTLSQLTELAELPLKELVAREK